MTLKDFLKRIDIENEETLNKMMLYSDGIGWTNIEVEETNNDILIKNSINSPFSDEQESKI